MMIAEGIKRAQAIHKQVIEAAYDGLCTVYGMVSRKDPITHVTRSEERVLIFEEPCHLSFSSVSTSQETDTVFHVNQTIKLFLSSDKEIEPGCRIEVTRNGRTENYGRSGKAAVYASHQEIVLEVWEGYA